MIATMSQVIRDTRAADLRHNTPVCSNSCRARSSCLQSEGARAHERQRETRERSSRSKGTQVIKQIRVTMFPSELLQGVDDYRVNKFAKIDF
jgi:hypothetical protein